jgi:threonyl-tRNA synthetase
MMRVEERVKVDDLYKIRHSTAHVMAQAVLELYPEAKLAIGPPTDTGFYYDFDLGTDAQGKVRTFTPADLGQIEVRMRQIIQEAHPFIYRKVEVEEACLLFSYQPYKLELIDGLARGTLDEYGNELDEKPVISTYRQDTFEDLCRGPHVAHTGEIPLDGFKLMSVAGAYWRGDEKRPMLQRIYGTAWRNRDELQHYLWQLAEAERRDHRRLGKELELFHLDPTAPGMPYWLPKGLKVLRRLLDFWRSEHEQRGYQEIASPLLNDRKLYEISGHWEHYKDSMFLLSVSEHVTYGLKPMNCPNAMVVYNLKVRSYRELPLRLSDCDTLHRHESSGTLHGLLRVQNFQQDDAHIFVTEEQIEEEYGRILEIADYFYRIFDLKYTLRLGTRPASYIGDPETWERAEAALRRILNRHTGGPTGYLVEEGDGAFYGPKIDIVMEDALGRAWQMGTIQLDFQLPRRFNCTYIDRHGSEQNPIVIHRVIYGSLERFIGLLLEHTAGALPVWLAPVQVRVIPITDKQFAYAEKVTRQLQAVGLSVEVDLSRHRMNAKIREAQQQKIPYMLIVGAREAADETISVRLRSEENLGAISLEAFIEMAQRAITERSTYIS